MKLDRETVHNLKNTGMTFDAIGKMFGKTRQYAWNLYSGYDSIYKKTEKHKMYKRHYVHHTPSTKLVKPCDYCVNDQKVNVVPQILS